DPDVLPILSEMKFQDLFNGSIIVDTSVACFQILGQGPLIDQAAEPQICFKPIVECFYVLRFQNLTDELQSSIAAEFRAFRQFCETLGGYRQGECGQHLIDISSLNLHCLPPFPDASAGS